MTVPRRKQSLEYARAYRAANRERLKAYQHEHYVANRERVLARTKARKAANRDLVHQENRAWFLRNRADKLAKNRAWQAANRDRLRALNAAWREANKERKNVTRNVWRVVTGAGAADKAVRRGHQLRATPPWLTREQKREMVAIYRAGREQKLHVDHIVPLRGKRVCGLHVPWNLQLLLPTENLRKHAKHETDIHLALDAI